jgi:hypothetical protein
MNNPKVEVAEDAKKIKEEEREFKAKMEQYTTEIKEAMDAADAKARATEEYKLETLYNVGGKLEELVNLQPDGVKKTVVTKMAKAAGRAPATFYTALNLYKMFTDEQIEQAKKNGLTVKTAAALVSITDEKTRNEMFRRAIEEGLTSDEIRTIRGSKGTRAAAAKKNRRDKDAKKPPFQVFSKGLDVLDRAKGVIDSCSDAVNRLSDVNSDDGRKDAIKALLQVRESLKDVTKQADAFIKYTDSFEGKKKRAGSK